MKKSLGSHIGKTLITILGAAICAAGVRLILLSGVGADPLTMLEEGISLTFGLDVGMVVWAINIGFFLIGLLCNRKSIGVGTLTTALTMGPALSLFTRLPIPAPATLPGGIVMNLAGILLVGLGIATYLSADYGAGALEVVMVFIAEKTHKTYGLVRVLMDCAWLVIGIFFGGTLGVGTLLGAFGIGISMEIWLRLIRRFILKKPSEA